MPRTLQAEDVPDAQTVFVRNLPDPCPDMQADGAPLTTSGLDLRPPSDGGRYRHIVGWSSENLPTPRDLFLYLPEAYLAEPERSFPVLVLHDGQNLFDGDLSYVKGQTWRSGTTMDACVREGRVEPLILLGVGNTGCHRMAEYTPTTDPRLNGGKGPLYAELLVHELLPVAQRDLRTLPGPENTGIGGSSLGGLISLSIALHYPSVFGKVGVLSPSLWWNRRAMLDELRGLPGKLPLRIWIDMGTGEGNIHLRDADAAVHLLQGKGWHLDGGSTPPEPVGIRRLSSPFERRPVASGKADLHYERVPQGLHNEAAWAARFGDVLQFLFPVDSDA